jgi:hypothetical protein
MYGNKSARSGNCRTEYGRVILCTESPSGVTGPRLLNIKSLGHSFSLADVYLFVCCMGGFNSVRQSQSSPSSHICKNYDLHGTNLPSQDEARLGLCQALYLLYCAYPGFQAVIFECPTENMGCFSPYYRYSLLLSSCGECELGPQASDQGRKL